jgi:hypothetical protein
MLNSEVQQIEITSSPLYRIVSKKLPIAHLVDYVTKGDEGLAQNLITLATEKYSGPHKRWEAVRHDRASMVTGSFITDENTGLVLSHTGWEGYFVGSGLTPEEIVRAQALIGTRLVSSMELMYPHSYSVIKRIFETGTGYSMDALRKIEIDFKAIKARFDGRDYSQEAKIFRKQTSEIVQKMPPIQMQREYDGITQFVPLPNGDRTATIQPTSLKLTYKERQGYKFMEKVGIVGQPLIRAMLEIS